MLLSFGATQNHKNSFILLGRQPTMSSLPTTLQDFLTSVKVETDLNKTNCWKKVGDNTYFYFNQHGQCSNDPEHGYAVVSFWSSGAISKIYKYLNGQKHSTLGPEFQSFDPEGNLLFEEYWVNGLLCRTKEIWEEKCRVWKTRSDLNIWLEAKEAKEYEYTSSPIYKYYSKYENKLLHSVNGPAHKIFKVDGTLYRDEYFQNGKLHNIHGPAIKNYGDQQGPNEVYFINGQKLDNQEEWKKAVACFLNDPGVYDTYKFIDSSIGMERTIKINKEEFNKFFGSYVKYNKEGKPTNIKLAPTYKEISEQGKHYSNSNPETIFVRDNGMVWYNSSNVSDTSSWLGPCEVTFAQTTGCVSTAESSKRYFIDGVAMQYQGWLNLALGFVDGLPNWLRHTELKKYGFVESMTIPEFATSEEVQEKLKGFFDGPNRKMCYTYNKECFILIKVNDRVIQKIIPLYPGISEGVVNREWERNPETYKSAKIVHGQGIQNVTNISRIQFESMIDALNKFNSHAFLNPEDIREILDESRHRIIAELEEAHNMKVKLHQTKNEFTTEEIVQSAFDLERAKQNLLGAVSAATSLAVAATKKADTPPEPKGFIATAKSDATLVARRIAAAKITNIAHSLLLNLLSANKTQNQKTKIKANLESVLGSENGKAITSFAIGLLLPVIQSQLDSKYHQLLEDMSQEFRVQGETVALEKLYDAVASPVVQTIKASVDSLMANSIEDEKIRVEGVTATSEQNILEEHEILSVSIGNKYLN